MVEVPDEIRAARLAELFDLVVDSYDNVGVPFFGPIAERLIAEVDPRAGARVLDIGCGRGAVLFRLAEAVGPGGEVVGIDVSPKMIAATAHEARARGLTNVSVQVMDATAPTLPRGAFDAITASFMIFFLPDPAAALTAWRSLLVPHGTVGVSTFGAWDRRWEQMEDLFGPYRDRAFFRLDPRDPNGPFGSDGAVEGLMRTAGLVHPRTVAFDLDLFFDDTEQWYAWTRSHGQRQLWDSIPADDLDRVRDAALARVDGWRDEQGRITSRHRIRLTLAQRP
ncbi:class I SAM-dependent methyltransferase [Rhodococcus sp. TAF43]|uniref:class I SAM-dependent methyltransferase n=1 Tax=unclassified Rhodococcus (in: high G+C Gram-positive bacteria) TaxID=192944 RepID=UPI001583FD03|nr:class I SAM-dependent methyltransferase [Rhodococcus sp. W8901]QKT11760.1 methyltransferase domain-containing protein [Rhodococcus sp. W8901]